MYLEDKNRGVTKRLDFNSSYIAGSGGVLVLLFLSESG